MNNFIKIKNLYKIFGNNTTEALNLVKTGISKEELLDKTNCVLGLNNINLDIPKGKIHVIMGLSGSGKSTLIRHLNRLIEPTFGEITIDGVNVLELNNKDLSFYAQLKSSNRQFKRSLGIEYTPSFMSFFHISGGYKRNYYVRSEEGVTDKNFSKPSFTLGLGLDLFGVNFDIYPAANWQLLKQYGGHLSIDEFRDQFNKIEYIDLDNRFSNFPLQSCSTKLFEQKIKF